MNKYFILAIISIFFISCELGRRQTYTPPECIDPCEGKDVSVFDIENVDFSNVYFKYGYSDRGVPITNFTGNGVILSHSQLPNGLPLNNTKFNHFYFFSTPEMNPQDSIGSFIYKNNQPTNVAICKLRVLINGNFSAEDSRIKIIHTKKNGSIRYAQLNTYNYLTFNFGQSQINFGGFCGTSTVLSAPANYYHHLYFYGQEGSNASENNVFNKLIYKNTKSEKININNIVVR